MLKVLLFAFCLLLLQIIERFKDVVGGRSCGLSFFYFFFFNLCLLYLPFSTWVMVAFGFWSTSSFISTPAVLLLLLLFFLHHSFSNLAIKDINMCRSQHKPGSCQPFEPSSALSSVAPIWHGMGFDQRQLYLQGHLCSRDSHFTGVMVSWWLSERRARERKVKYSGRGDDWQLSAWVSGPEAKFALKHLYVTGLVWLKVPWSLHHEWLCLFPSSFTSIQLWPTTEWL